MPNFTKKAIIDSFLKLLNERPLSKITVKDIVEDCGINRNSFYYHFQDLPALLDAVIVEQANKICAFPEGTTLLEGVKIVLEYIVENKKAIYHIWSSANRASYEQNLLEICGYVVKKCISFFQYETTVNKKDEELIIHFMTCAFWGQLTDWLCQKMSYDIVAYAERLCQLFNGCMDIAVKNSIRIPKGKEKGCRPAE